MYSSQNLISCEVIETYVAIYHGTHEHIHLLQVNIHNQFWSSHVTHVCMLCYCYFHNCAPVFLSILFFNFFFCSGYLIRKILSCFNWIVLVAGTIFCCTSASAYWSVIFLPDMLVTFNIFVTKGTTHMFTPLCRKMFKIVEFDSP